MGSDNPGESVRLRRKRMHSRVLGVACCGSCLCLGLTSFGPSHNDPGSRLRGTTKSSSAIPDPQQQKPAEMHPATRRLPLLYGTAWKKEQTTDLVVLAIRLGFRGIDTACQPKHYRRVRADTILRVIYLVREELVGNALAIVQVQDGISRDELWIQTKFTPFTGQDPNNCPYDAAAPLEEQVEQSIAKSLSNLKTSRIDSLVLHSPLQRLEDTITVWRKFEQAVDNGVVNQLGISNCHELRVI